MINQIWFTFGDLLVNCLPDPSSSKQGGPEVGTWSWHRHCDGCSCPMGLECCCLLYKSNTGKHAALQSRWWQSPGSNGMQNYDNFDNLVKSFDETSFSDLADVWCMEVCFWCPIFGQAFFWRKVRKRIVWQIQRLERRSRRTEARHSGMRKLRKFTAVEVQFMFGAVCSHSCWFLLVELTDLMLADIILFHA